MSAGAMGCGWQPPASTGGLHPALLDPWEAAPGMGEGAVIALLVGTEGPAYRNIGTAMAIGPDGSVAGAITSGCIEADLVLQAQDMMARGGRPRRLRYGEGSPFFDLKLPCGGAVELLLFPLRDPEVLTALAEKRRNRVPVSLRIGGEGRLALAPFAGTRADAQGFTLGFRPPLRLIVPGMGAEALVFARLAASLGHEHLLLSHDAATLASAAALGVRAQKLSRMAELDRLGIDRETAVVMFYHDHDYEPGLLGRFLFSPAFYIGAQGSRRTAETRRVRLREAGVPEARIGRLKGPIGLIPSTRDPQTLALSVMAEVVVERNRVQVSGVPAAI